MSIERVGRTGGSALSEGGVKFWLAHGGIERTGVALPAGRLYFTAGA